MSTHRRHASMSLAAATLCVLGVSTGCGKSLVGEETAGSTTAPPAQVAPVTVGESVPQSTQTATARSAIRRTGLSNQPAGPVSSTAPAGPQGRTGEASLPAPPPIVQSPIPFGARRKAEMVRYAERHYGMGTYRLIEPHVIVIHFTETPDFKSTFDTFAPDVPDSELHELPNTCAHFVVDANGTIHQLVGLGIMCRHTVGLNWTAIGVEHVGYSDAEVLDRAPQMRASLRLVRWLRCRYRIPIEDVIGHNESLSSPFHHENVPSLRMQTHNDFNRVDMGRYRARLRAAGGC